MPGRATEMATARPIPPEEPIERPVVSHNLLGQRLGRKGRGTRERILAATERLIEDPAEPAISLSAVARAASLGMTTLYLYFSDLTELLLALLEPVMADAEPSHVAHLRARWSDHSLAGECLVFVKAYHAFWRRHARILHLRNYFADAGDERMLAHRIDSSHPLAELIVRQMDSADVQDDPAPLAMATVLLTGIERVVTVNTDAHLVQVDYTPARLAALLAAQARLMEVGIAECRAAAHGAAA